MSLFILKKKNVLVVKSILGNGNLKKLKKRGPRQRRRKPAKWKVEAHNIPVWGWFFYLNLESPIKFTLLWSSLFIINRLPLVSVSHTHTLWGKKNHSLTLSLTISHYYDYNKFQALENFEFGGERWENWKMRVQQRMRSWHC